MSRKTTRLYYGMHKETKEPLYWVLKVINATKPVTLDGTVEHAMSGRGGVSIGCHLSNTTMGNKGVFPHPCLIASFTKSVALIITKITKGKPTHCVRYRHSYSKYVDLNDRCLTKEAVKANPKAFERQFKLLPYKTQEPHWKERYGRNQTGERAALQVTRGELGRMRNAGLVYPDLTAL